MADQNSARSALPVILESYGAGASCRSFADRMSAASSASRTTISDQPSAAESPWSKASASALSAKWKVLVFVGGVTPNRTVRETDVEAKPAGAGVYPGAECICVFRRSEIVAREADFNLIRQRLGFAVLPAVELGNSYASPEDVDSNCRGLWCGVRHETGLDWFNRGEGYKPHRQAGNSFPTVTGSCRTGRRPADRHRPKSPPSVRLARWPRAHAGDVEAQACSPPQHGCSPLVRQRRARR
jgi:hypothetical protein